MISLFVDNFFSSVPEVLFYRPSYTPEAFKFYMELHIENVLSLHNEREKRRKRLEIEMEKILLSEEKKVKMRSILCQKESEYLRLKRAKMKRNMFKKIARLGVGAFGEVSLVRKRDTEAFYAMKTLRKSDVIRRNQVPFISTFFLSFTTELISIELIFLI